jgi:hypothetical protein
VVDESKDLTKHRDDPSWVARLCDEVGDRSQSIRVALDDLAALLSWSTAEPVYYVVPEKPPMASPVGIWILAPGVLFSVWGKPDDGSSFTTNYGSRCEYSCWAIGLGARVAAIVSADVRREFAHDRIVHQDVAVVRNWTFHIAGTGPLDFEAHEPDFGYQASAAPFARALAAEIARNNAAPADRPPVPG